MLKNTAKQEAQKSVFLADILKLTVNVAHAKEKWTAYNDVVGETENKRAFGRHRHEWENSKNNSLQETGWEDNYIGLA